MNDYMTQVWRIGDPPPLTANAPMPEPDQESEAEAQQQPRHNPIPWRKLIAIAWCIGFATLHLTAIKLLLTNDPILQQYCTSPLQPIVAVIAPFALWTITLVAIGEISA